LHEVWINTPFLLFLDSCIDIVHSPDITDNPGEISEVARNVEFRIVESGCRSWDTQIQRIYVDCQVRPPYPLSVEILETLGKTDLAAIQSSAHK
jgi:hypothetical protein